MVQGLAADKALCLPSPPSCLLELFCLISPHESPLSPCPHLPFLPCTSGGGSSALWAWVGGFNDWSMHWPPFHGGFWVMVADGESPCPVVSTTNRPWGKEVTQHHSAHTIPATPSSCVYIRTTSWTEMGLEVTVPGVLGRPLCCLYHCGIGPALVSSPGSGHPVCIVGIGTEE